MIASAWACDLESLPVSDHLAFVDTELTVTSFCSSQSCLSLFQNDTSADGSGLLRTQQDLGSCLEGGVGDDGLRSFLNELDVRVVVEAGKATGIDDDEVTRTAG